MNATLLTAYGLPHPYGPDDPSDGLLSSSQGNLQYFPNGNAFMGWGSDAFVSEHLNDGSPIFSAYFATTGALHYRALKFNLTTTPTDQQALYSYAHNDSAPTSFYASWNGATKVASWTSYGGSSATAMAKLGNTAKNGFETIAQQPGYYAYTMVGAITSNGFTLHNSSIIKTFVPGLAAVCTESQCPLVGKLLSPGREQIFLQPCLTRPQARSAPPRHHRWSRPLATVRAAGRFHARRASTSPSR